MNHVFEPILSDLLWSDDVLSQPHHRSRGCGVQPYRGSRVDGYYRAVPLLWSVRPSAVVGEREREGEIAWGDMYPHLVSALSSRARLWALGTCFGLWGGVVV